MKNQTDVKEEKDFLAIIEMMEDAANLEGDARFTQIKIAADYAQDVNAPILAYCLRWMHKHRKFPEVRLKRNVSLNGFDKVKEEVSKKFFREMAENPKTYTNINAELLSRIKKAENDFKSKTAVSDKDNRYFIFDINRIAKNCVIETKNIVRYRKVPKNRCDSMNQVLNYVFLKLKPVYEDLVEGLV